VPNADPGGSEAGEVPLSHSSARAVAAVRLLMTISLDLETPMKLSKDAALPGSSCRAVPNSHDNLELADLRRRLHWTSRAPRANAVLASFEDEMVSWT
jgi:hypothetical protein